MIKQLKIYKGKAGKNAYKVSDVWRLGFHYFINGGDKILRFCYFRGKDTHYIELAYKFREVYEVDESQTRAKL